MNFLLNVSSIGETKQNDDDDDSNNNFKRRLRVRLDCFRTNQYLGTVYSIQYTVVIELESKVKVKETRATFTSSYV